MPRAEIIACPNVHVQHYNGGGTNYVVETPTGVKYKVYVDGSIDVVFTKSTDGGLTWSIPALIFTGTTQALAVWYDRWSNIAAGLIHCAYTETGANDILYRNIDTASADALGTQTTVFAGASAIAGGSLTITRAIGGNLVVAGSIDAGTEDGAWESADVGATWGSTIADPSEGATLDQYLLLPGWNADTQDVMLIFWDASTNELSVKRYDNSGNSWAETLISASMTESSSANGFPNFAAAVDITNSRNIVAAWSQVDVANADLRCWTITDTDITEVTNVVLNSGDDQALCAVGIDTLTGYWYVFYGGKSDGSETATSAINTYYKVSADAGTTWGPETLLSNSLHNMQALTCVPRSVGPPGAMLYQGVANTLNYLLFSTIVPQQRARFQIGM